MNAVTEAVAEVIAEINPTFSELAETVSLLAAGIFAKSIFAGGHEERMVRFDEFFKAVREEVGRVVREEGEPPS